MSRGPRGTPCVTRIVLVFLVACAQPKPMTAIDRVVADVCSKQVVLLGEATHRDGETFLVKTTLVKRLIDECGFKTVLVESGVYDYIALRRAIARGNATLAHLTSAIGKMWTHAADLAPLFEDLFARAAAKQIVIGGIDDQISSTATFAQTALPALLAADAACETELGRFTRYEYDQPYDAAARDRVLACLARARPANDEDAAMAAALTRLVERSLDQGPGGFAARDASMFELLRWHAKSGGKLLVWCHSIHAAKRGDPMPLGAHVHRTYGDRAAAIGFSAVSGEYARVGQPARALEPPPPDSLEAAATGAITYFDRAALAKRGAIKARPYEYQFREARWADLLDGMIVLQTERPTKR
jgi:erythromycin esterase-like protein